METFLKDLQQPEYIHVLLNPIPIYALAAGLFVLVLGLIIRGRKTQLAALALVALAAVSAWPVYHYGQVGYHRVKTIADAEGVEWLDAHMHRGETWIWVFYATAFLGAVSVTAGWKWPRALAPLSIATTIFSLAALTAGVWIAYPGGKIRHSEFRNSPPPETDGHQHEH